MLGGKRCILRTVNISMSYMNYFHHHKKFLVTCSLTSHTQLHKLAAIFCPKELRAYASFKTISYLFSLSLGMERRKVFPAWFFFISASSRTEECCEEDICLIQIERRCAIYFVVKPCWNAHSKFWLILSLRDIGTFVLVFNYKRNIILDYTGWILNKRRRIST